VRQKGWLFRYVCNRESWCRIVPAPGAIPVGSGPTLEPKFFRQRSAIGVRPYSDGVKYVCNSNLHHISTVRRAYDFWESTITSASETLSMSFSWDGVPVDVGDLPFAMWLARSRCKMLSNCCSATLSKLLVLCGVESDPQDYS
jgi:hypothetical protein